MHFDRYRPEVKARWRETDTPGGGIWYDLGLIDQALVFDACATYTDQACQWDGAGRRLFSRRAALTGCA